MNSPANALLLWLLTYLVHSSLLLVAAWAVERFGLVRTRAFAEGAWKLALVGGLLTASLQTGLVDKPLAGRYVLAAPVESVAALPEPASPPRAASSQPIQNSANESAVAVSTLPQSSESHQRGRSDIAGAEWLLVLWALGMLALIARLALAARAARLELADRVPLLDATVQERTQWLARRAGMAGTPAVSVSETLAGPVSLPSGEICLPRWAVQLPPVQLDAMLAHEIAHVARRDPQWLLAALAMRALFFFQPLNLLAQKRLAALAEFACDDWAAEHAGSGRALAECLAGCAERMRRTAIDRFSFAMASPRSALHVRVERLIDGVRDLRKLPPLLKWTAPLALAAFAFLVPGFGIATSAAAAGSHGHATPAGASHVSIESNDGNQMLTASFSNDERSIKVMMDGRVEFNDAETGIAHIADGATLQINESRDGTDYRAYFSGTGGDRFARHFYVNGTEKPFDKNAQQWLARVVPDILRNTGINAKQRVARILAKHGAAGVIAEIDKISSDYVRSIYIRELVASGPLAAKPMAAVLAQAAEIKSSYSLSQSLKAILDYQQLDAAQMLALINDIAGIDSDYGASTTLQAVAAKLTPTPQLTDAYLKAAAKISSDYSHFQALKALLVRPGLPAAAVAKIFTGAAKIGSDYEKEQLLTVGVKLVGNSHSLVSAYVNGTHAIASPYEKSRALLALLRESQLDKQGYAEVLTAARDITSDYNRAQVATALARQMPKDPALIAQFHQLTHTMSPYQRSQAEAALEARTQ